MEQGESLHFTAGGIEKRSAEYIHSLHVDSGLICDARTTKSAAGAVADHTPGSASHRGGLFRYAWGCINKELHLAPTTGRESRTGATLALRIVKLPRNSIKESDQTGFCDASFEKGIGG